MRDTLQRRLKLMCDEKKVKFAVKIAVDVWFGYCAVRIK
jgi:hypothetical protein